MLRALQILIAFALAIGGGMVSSSRLIDAWPMIGADRYGPWRVLPMLGRQDADPYTRAFQHRETRRRGGDDCVCHDIAEIIYPDLERFLREDDYQA